jgi:hypothetical protein
MTIAAGTGAIVGGIGGRFAEFKDIDWQARPPVPLGLGLANDSSCAAINEKLRLPRVASMPRAAALSGG